MLLASKRWTNILRWRAAVADPGVTAHQGAKSQHPDGRAELHVPFRSWALIPPARDEEICRRKRCRRSGNMRNIRIRLIPILNGQTDPSPFLRGWNRHLGARTSHFWDHQACVAQVRWCLLVPCTIRSTCGGPSWWLAQPFYPARFCWLRIAMLRCTYLLARTPAQRTRASSTHASTQPPARFPCRNSPPN